MDEINRIYENIAKSENLDGIRNDIIKLMKNVLNSFGQNINNWQKTCLASAIGALSWNLSQGLKSSDAFLRVSLLNIEKSMTPSDKRDDEMTSNIEGLNKISYELLMASINDLP